VKEVLRTQDLGHALLLRIALEAAGIEAVVQGYMAATHMGAGGVSLHVHDADLARALEVVSEVETEADN